MYTMASLEKALAVNPRPLLFYSATKDFTAENIVFLMQVRRWRAAFSSAPTINGRVTDETRAHLFASAVDIYAACVSEKTAEYPINVEGPIRNALNAVFAHAAPDGEFAQKLQSARFKRTMQWAEKDRESSCDSTEPFWEKSGTGMHDTKITALPSQKDSLFQPHPGVAPFGKSRARIPAEFDESVFNAAEKSIKYLVLTNTWWKFVSAIEQGLGGSPESPHLDP